MIEQLRTLCQAGNIIWTHHAITRMIQRGISREEVKKGIMTGEIIEDYPKDYPYPSCLILSMNIGEKPLHIVSGVTDTELWIITAYRPDLQEWKPDFKTRRENRS